MKHSKLHLFNMASKCHILANTLSALSKAISIKNPYYAEIIDAEYRDVLKNYYEILISIRNPMHKF